jgi:hypothetical protein
MSMGIGMGMGMMGTHAHARITATPHRGTILINTHTLRIRFVSSRPRRITLIDVL